jgi:glycosyltransferase involved in cell wall biosynthesis
MTIQNDARRRPVTVWWGIPCKSIIPVFQAVYEQFGRDVLFVALNNLPEHRRKLGWGKPEHGQLPLHILDDATWTSAVNNTLGARDGLHIINGIYHNERVRYVARALLAQQRTFGVIMEAPANLETGVRRLAKSVLMPMVTPLKTWRVARQAEFVLSASGERHNAFRTIGFKAERIFPFGYFPDFPLFERAPEARELKILCIGYLEPFKGQDLLLEALAIIKHDGVPFSCKITGYGSCLKNLMKLTGSLGLADQVLYPGVVSNEVLEHLFRESTLLVAPGRVEPWGIRVNEALLSGLPVVVSDGVGAKELIQVSGAGEIFRSCSARSLAEALERIHRRLQSSDELLTTVREFRRAITPSAAASYLEEVISFGERNGELDRRPVPPWHDRACWKTQRAA